jgi:molecular chaperone Hsp33
MSEQAAPAERQASAIPDDDIVLPFRVPTAGVMGRVVRLGGVVDTILTRHDYPEPVSRLLGEALALAALLGASMKPDSRLTLQTKGDGPVPFLVVNYEKPGRVSGKDDGGQMRGYASVTAERWAAFAKDRERIDEGDLLGHGLLAMTIDPGSGQPSYQGIVALDGKTLSEVALEYFQKSEQLPSLLRLVVARHFTAGIDGSPGTWTWRAGGLLVQHVAGEQAAVRSLGDEDEGRIAGGLDEDWSRIRTLAETVEDHELLDPTLSAERLLYRLFHEEGVTVTPAQGLSGYCRCSQERVAAMMRSFDPSDIAEMREPDGAITVTCEFCNTKYRLEPGEQV